MILRTMLPAAAIAAAVGAFAALPASARTVKADKIDLSSWDYEELYRNGFSAEEFMDAEVASKDGDDIGEVEDLVVGPKGSITHLIVETDSFLDFGDSHLMVPLDEAKIQGMDLVTVSIDEQRLESYSLFPDVEDENLPERKWRISELIDDYAYLKDRKAYGYVEDVIVSKGGDVRAVVVTPDITYGAAAGPYAVPYYGYGYDPGLDYYEMPYAADDLDDLERFEYAQLRGIPTVNETDKSADKSGSKSG